MSLWGFRSVQLYGDKRKLAPLQRCGFHLSQLFVSPFIYTWPDTNFIPHDGCFLLVQLFLKWSTPLLSLSPVTVMSAALGAWNVSGSQLLAFWLPTGSMHHFQEQLPPRLPLLPSLASSRTQFNKLPSFSDSLILAFLFLLSTSIIPSHSRKP